MKNLKDKVALVTGGASGIGKSIVERFAAEGTKVVVADLAEVDGRAVADNASGLFVRTDVSDPKAVESAVSECVRAYKRLDIFVNCAAIQPSMATVHEIDLEKWQQILSVNLNGTLHGMKYAINQFVAQGGGGVVINLSSISGLVALPQVGAYAAAKAAIGNLTKLAAVEYGDQGIRVNAIAPTAVMTPLTQAFIDGTPDPAATQKEIEAYNPLVGLVQPEDIASAVAFLASDDARFISGVILPVDGAYTAK